MVINSKPNTLDCGLLCGEYGIRVIAEYCTAAKELDVSWYLTIRSDPGYSQYAATAALVEFLADQPELRQTGPIAFEAASEQPWVAVILAACDPKGNFASDDVFVSAINVVELICSYSYDEEWYLTLASRIARFLDWSVFKGDEERQPNVQ